MKVNLGSGNRYLEDFCNCDVSLSCKTDLRFDFEKFPWPIDDSAVEYILAGHSLEHAHQDMFPDLVREMYRISKNNAEWLIHVPHGSSDMFLKDPTHRMRFHRDTFLYWVDGSYCRDLGMIYGWGDVRLQQKSAILNGEVLTYELIVVK